MILHIADKALSSWSMRPWLLIESAGVACEVREHSFLNDKAAQRAQWLAVSPTAKLPALHDNGRIIWDSLAICLYLAERHPQMLSDSPDARAWSYAAAAEMHSGFTALRTQCPFHNVPQPPLAPDAALEADLQRIDRLWQQGLAEFGGAFLGGSRFTLADAFYAPVACRIAFYGLGDRLSPPSQQYLHTIMTHPAVLKWLAG